VSAELKPCPFCGSPATALTMTAYCTNADCGASCLPWDERKGGGAESWNRRAAPAAQLVADLPPLPRSMVATRHGTPCYTVGQMMDHTRQAIASRDAHIASLERELAAASQAGRAYQRKVDEKIMARRASIDGQLTGAPPPVKQASIGDDPEFIRLMIDHHAALGSQRVARIRKQIIALIDGRPSGGEQGQWKVLSENDKPDASRPLDVILTNGVCLMVRDYSKVDWTQVRDWRYAAAPTNQPKGDGK
jgi:hypothetical protein